MEAEGFHLAVLKQGRLKMSEISKPIVFLKGVTVTLRPVLEEDVPLMLRWMNDQNVTQYLRAYLPMTEAGEKEWFANYHKRQPNDIILMLVVDGKPIGVMGLHRISFKDGTATTGAYIGESEYWGNGHGSEAKMLLLNYAFNELNLRKITSNVIAFNERSYKYSIKCGYKEEARLKDQIFTQGKYWDEIILAVFKEDWLPLWKKFVEQHDLKLPTP